MLDYFKKGWKGELRFSQIIISGGDFLLGGGLAYIGFYILLAMLFFTQKQWALTNIVVLVFLLYGIVFYIWLLKAFWGSANQCTSRVSAALIRVFTLFLPILSIILFILVLVFYILQAIIGMFS